MLVSDPNRAGKTQLTFQKALDDLKEGETGWFVGSRFDALITLTSGIYILETENPKRTIEFADKYDAYQHIIKFRG